jgi:hypothetical protein
VGICQYGHPYLLTFYCTLVDSHNSRQLHLERSWISWFLPKASRTHLDNFFFRTSEKVKHRVSRDSSLLGIFRRVSETLCWMRTYKWTSSRKWWGVPVTSSPLPIGSSVCNLPRYISTSIGSFTDQIWIRVAQFLALKRTCQLVFDTRKGRDCEWLPASVFPTDPASTLGYLTGLQERLISWAKRWTSAPSHDRNAQQNTPLTHWRRASPAETKHRMHIYATQWCPPWSRPHEMFNSTAT